MMPKKELLLSLGSDSHIGRRSMAIQLHGRVDHARITHACILRLIKRDGVVWSKPLAVP